MAETHYLEFRAAADARLDVLSNASLRDAVGRVERGDTRRLGLDTRGGCRLWLDPPYSPTSFKSVAVHAVP